MLEDTRTLYVGGAASYETVEDSIQFNLELVDRLFDQPTMNPMSATGEDLVVEQLLFDLPWVGAAGSNGTTACNSNSDVVQRYLDADNATWTVFLKKQPGFIRKYTMLVAQPPSSSQPEST